MGDEVNSACLAPLDQALEAARLGRVDESENRLREIVALQPNHLNAWGHLAHVLAQQGKVSEAIPCYQHVIELEPRVVEAYLLLGDAYLSLGERRKALQTYRRLEGTPRFSCSEIQSRIARCEILPVYLLKRGIRVLPEFIKSMAQPGFVRALKREVALAPRSLKALKTSGLYAFMGFLYQSLVREKTFRWKPQPCDLCGGSRFEAVFYFRRHKINRCRNCSLECVERRPPEGQDIISGHFEREDVISELEVEWQDPAVTKVRIESMRGLFERAGEQFPQAGKLLYEIGCGQGHLLKALSESGMGVGGMDASERLVSYCRERHGLAVEQLALSNLTAPTEPYDYVIAFHVIEHLSHPSQLFEKASLLLRPDGYLFVETPVPELDGMPLRNKLDNQTGYANLEHMHFFTLDTLTEYFRRHGYEVVGTYRHLTNGGVLGRRDVSSMS